MVGVVFLSVKIYSEKIFWSDRRRVKRETGHIVYLMLYYGTLVFHLKSPFFFVAFLLLVNKFAQSENSIIFLLLSP